MVTKYVALISLMLSLEMLYLFICWLCYLLARNEQYNPSVSMHMSNE